MKKLFFSLFLLSYCQFVSCDLENQVSTYELYLLKRAADCTSQMNIIYYTKGKDDVLYGYWSGRQDAYYDSLFHTKNPDWINLKEVNAEDGFYTYRMSCIKNQYP